MDPVHATTICTVTTTIRAVRVNRDAIRADLNDGRTVVVPSGWFPAVCDADRFVRQTFHLDPSRTRIIFPLLGLEVSIQQMLRCNG